MDYSTEGGYQENWPLYLGLFDSKGDSRDEIAVAGDGDVS